MGQGHPALIEAKVEHWEGEDPLNLEHVQNHPSEVSGGPSQNRLKARANLVEKRIVMMRTIFLGQLLVRLLYLVNDHIIGKRTIVEMKNLCTFESLCDYLLNINLYVTVDFVFKHHNLNSL